MCRPEAVEELHRRDGIEHQPDLRFHNHARVYDQICPIQSDRHAPVEELVRHFARNWNALILQFSGERTLVHGLEESVSERAVDVVARRDDSARQLLEGISLRRELAVAWWSVGHRDTVLPLFSS